MPYILTPYGRCRQTPVLKHDQKTRHVDCHVAQPSYLASTLFNFGEVFRKATIRCCVRAAVLLGFRNSSFRRHTCTAFRGSGLRSASQRLRRRRYAKLQPGGGPFPHPPISKNTIPYSRDIGIIPHRRFRNQAQQRKIQTFEGILNERADKKAAQARGAAGRV